MDTKPGCGMFELAVAMTCLMTLIGLFIFALIK